MATQYYTAASVDGFIADADNELDWLFVSDIDEAGPMAYAGFFDHVGAICLGATTYQWVLDHDDWPYDVPAVVMTHRRFPVPTGDVRFTDAPVAQVHAELVEAAQGKNVWVVGGGDLVGQFHDAGLLDEVWVQYAPWTLGSGAPLLPRRVPLMLRDVQRNRDFVCARYDVVRPR